MGLTLLAQASMPLKYWVDAFQSVVYLINRLPTPVLKGKSPFEIIHSKRPDYQFLKAFGTAWYPCLRPYQSQKFHFHSTKCVNLGYSDHHKGYKCLSSTGRLYISRNVVFNEADFPFKNGFLNMHKNESNIQVATPQSWFTLPIPNTNPVATTPDLTHTLSNSTTATSNDSLSTPASPEHASGTHSSSAKSPASPTNSSGMKFQEPVDISSNLFVDLHIPPTTSYESQQHACEDISVATNEHPMITRSKASIFKPRVYIGQAAWNEHTQEPT